MVALLSGRHRFSRREVRQMLQDLWQVQVQASLGAVLRQEQAPTTNDPPSLLDYPLARWDRLIASLEMLVATEAALQDEPWGWAWRLSVAG